MHYFSIVSCLLRGDKGMYKGDKVTKQLQEYIRLAQKKFYKLAYYEDVDLWEIINNYKMLAKQDECMQKYIYDYIREVELYKNDYVITNSVNGGKYIKRARKKVAI